MNAIEFNHVWKKFSKGEKFNSLRDAIPNFFYKTINKTNEELNKQEFWAVKDVDFEVKKGEVVGIIGSNGAGKSTILKLLSRILVPNKGEMRINGRLSALIEVTAGFHPDLTGRENVYLNGTILGMRKREIDAKFDEIVEFSGVSEFIDTPVKRYSSGMYARLGFSVAAHMNPDVMLVDEVLAVGDLNFQAKCAEKMRSLLNSGSTIVLVSHNLTLVQSMCKRVILLDKGVIAKTGNPEEVTSHYQNLVYEKRESQLKETAEQADYKIRLKENALVHVSHAVFYNDNGQERKNFKLGEGIYISFKYKAKEKIENPLFDLEIIRADGVLCCAFNTKNNGQIIKSISGEGNVNINLGKINLAPGIYIVKISIWDNEMVHPFMIRKNDIFRIDSVGATFSSDCVFLPPAKWEFK